MNMGVGHKQEDGMAVSMGRRLACLAASLLATVVVLAPASPASAQVPAGSQATAIVGGPAANCPPGSPPVRASASMTINGVTVIGAGDCTPLAADAEGSFTVSGSFTDPLLFTSECANVDGVIQNRGGVQVPAGTLVNGVAVPAVTTVTTNNTPVVFPGGRTAILNQVISTPTSLTRNAIVFIGGPTVGQVVCGAAAAYPLAVSTGGPSEAASAIATPASEATSGLSTATVAAGAAVALALLAQVAMATRLRRRQG
jgi:hypothetical protein